MPYKNREKQLAYMRNYQNVRKADAVRMKELRQLFLEHYDWLTDSYIIPREEAKQLTIL